MKESILMRVLICKIHCPFICFCKPSAAAAHLYSSAPLKLESTPQLPSTSAVASFSDASSDHLTTQIKDPNSNSDGKLHVENAIKSCIKKAPVAPGKTAENKRVQWIDNLGKELAQIKEFESGEMGDTDNEVDNRGCMCIIL